VSEGTSAREGAAIGEVGFRGEMTQEEALRLADALAGRAMKETEARCAVLAQFIHDCDLTGSRSSAVSDAVLELSAQQRRRRELIRRRSLIQQALECVVDESPAATLVPPPVQAARRAQRQVQVQARPRRRES
jgi:hypothetical protein